MSAGGDWRHGAKRDCGRIRFHSSNLYYIDENIPTIKKILEKDVKDLYTNSNDGLRLAISTSNAGLSLNDWEVFREVYGKLQIDLIDKTEGDYEKNKDNFFNFIKKAQYLNYFWRQYLYLVLLDAAVLNKDQTFIQEAFNNLDNEFKPVARDCYSL